ncbi:MAG: hypothetical protein E7364_01740 [Clostridiales bacterium]|nr:hypothetical protein [Clostridiales bacterium]
MELYHCNRLIVEFFGEFSKNKNSLLGLKLGFGVGTGIWLILFILQGIGLYTMAKRRGIKKRALAFVPFANLWYMGKLAGECRVFGRKVKRVGLYAMLAQIALTILMGLYLAAELYLFMKGEPIWHEDYYPVWDFNGFAGKVETFYKYGDLFIAIFELAYAILMIVLLNGLFKQYAPRKYMVLSILFVFLPFSRFITIFCLRNKQPIDYDAYMRARREAYIRQQQQYYNRYGNGPYGGNPYGGYNNPYGQNPYGNPYSQGQQRPPEEPFGEFGGKPKPDEPFDEFNGKGKKPKDPNDPDGFFD